MPLLCIARALSASLAWLHRSNVLGAEVVGIHHSSCLSTTILKFVSQFSLGFSRKSSEPLRKATSQRTVRSAKSPLVPDSLGILRRHSHVKRTECLQIVITIAITICNR